MTDKELIEELQKCNQDCEVDIFDETTGTILSTDWLDVEDCLHAIYLNTYVI